MRDRLPLAQAAGALGMTPRRWGLGSQGLLQDTPGATAGGGEAACQQHHDPPFGHLPPTGSAEPAVPCCKFRAVQACATAGRHGTHAAREEVKAVHSPAKAMHSLDW